MTFDPASPAHGEDAIEEFVRGRVPAGYKVVAGSVWLAVVPAGTSLPEQGWKLHVSSRAATFPALVETLLPVLLEAGCPFKLARSVRVLTDLNGGIRAPASVGKAFTIYPDQRHVRDLGLRLADVLRGHQGPRVLSDRRVSNSAPVYYRYGPSAKRHAPDARRLPETRLHGPDGEEFDALAILRYQQPPWAIDPFTEERGRSAERASDASQPALLGGSLRIISGIREAAQGNVYRATDQRDGSTVVVKQARALVAEHHDGVDARLRLRNERRVLEALKGIAGVPRFIDHFSHGDDEFLVTSDCGSRNLGEVVRQDGPYLPGESERSGTLEWLAAHLARIVRAVHDRGVVIRDLSPKNVVLGKDDVSIVDYGLAAYDGLRLPGGTPGFAPARQFRDEPPAEIDDLHALGMTLLVAAGLPNPVVEKGDSDLPRIRALQALRSVYGPSPSGVPAAMADLLSGDDDRARQALRKLATGTGYAGRRAVEPLPAVPDLSRELAAEIADNLLSDLCDEVSAILDGPEAARAAQDLSLYSGTAGIGLELLRNTSRADVSRWVGELAEFTLNSSRELDLSPGLFVGATGVELFLREAIDHGVLDAKTRVDTTTPSSDWTPDGDDLIYGAAGVGLGHLSLYRGHGDPADLAIARRCVAALLDPEVAHAMDPRAAAGAAPAVDPTAGSAHGLAGIVDMLLAFATETRDDQVLMAAADRAEQLARQTRTLIRAAAGGPVTGRLATSWCHGLTGIGQTLLRAGTLLDDPGLSRLAREAAGTCAALLPRVSEAGQCCGAAGIGNFFIDLACAEQDERYWDEARRVGIHILMRGAGTPTHPSFGEQITEGYEASWAAGLAGLLAFFRRFAAAGGPDALRLGTSAATSHAPQVPEPTIADRSGARA